MTLRERVADLENEVYVLTLRLNAWQEAFNAVVKMSGTDAQHETLSQGVVVPDSSQAESQASRYATAIEVAHAAAHVFRKHTDSLMKMGNE